MTRWLVAALMIALVPACASTTGRTTGVVVEVEGTLGDVEAFTVLADGEETIFLPIDGQEYEFPLDHLRDHLRSGEPVIVDWELRDEERYVLAITDG